jgi:dTDP-glucose pyrophosphorylase
MQPTLLILAAGIGSRYGGMKQVDPMGPSGEVLMDYSIYDAIQAGFGKVVFVIRHDFEEEFKQTRGRVYEEHIAVDYAFQELGDLPSGFSVPEGRVKPWGTGHAILVAREVINEPFCMINADDFYGRETYQVIGDALSIAELETTEWYLAGFKMGNVLSAHGGVTRAVCELNEGLLTSIVERFEIVQKGDHAIAKDKEGGSYELPLDTLTSMNFWGFTPRLFDVLEDGFRAFLQAHGTEMKAEYLIPTAVNDFVAAGQASVKALATDASWFGVTYPDDKPRVQASIKALVDQGEYPTPLWG